MGNIDLAPVLEKFIISRHDSIALNKIKYHGCKWKVRWFEQNWLNREKTKGHLYTEGWNIHTELWTYVVRFQNIL